MNEQYGQYDTQGIALHIITSGCNKIYAPLGRSYHSFKQKPTKGEPLC